MIVRHRLKKNGRLGSKGRVLLEVAESRARMDATNSVPSDRSRLQRGIADDLERETGLPGTRFETLVRLHRTPGHATRMNAMAAQVSFPPSSFSRLVDRMEAQRLVERVTDPTNRRATLVKATATGEDRLVEALAVHERRAQARLVDCLSEKEIDALETITRKIRDANATRRSSPGETTEPRTTLAG